MNSDWVGCRGSQPQYGSYPCGLWSLWHTLTIAQAARADSQTGWANQPDRVGQRGRTDPKEVLLAMKDFIQQFFGCRDCARHFDQTIEQVRILTLNTWVFLILSVTQGDRNSERKS